MEEGAAEVKQMEEAMNAKRTANKGALQRKLEAKKRKKAAQMKADAKYKVTRDAEQGSHAVTIEMERAAMLEAVQHLEISAIPQAIEETMSRRHQEETQQLAQAHGLARAKRVSQALSEVEEKLEGSLISLRGEFSREQDQLRGEGLDAGLLTKKLQGLQDSLDASLVRRKQSADFDNDAAERAATLELDSEQAGERLGMRERHLGEVANALSELCPDATAVTREKQAQAEELRQMREQLGLEHEQKLRRIRLDEEAIEREHDQAMTEQLRELDSQFDDERVRARETLEDHASALGDRKAALVSAQRDKHAAELAATPRDMSQQDKDSLLQRHDEELEQMDRTLDAEQGRQRAEMQAKLKQRRRAKKDSSRSEIERSFKESSDRQKDQLREEASEVQKQTVSQAHELLRQSGGDWMSNARVAGGVVERMRTRASAENSPGSLARKWRRKAKTGRVTGSSRAVSASSDDVSNGASAQIVQHAVEAAVHELDDRLARIESALSTLSKKR